MTSAMRQLSLFTLGGKPYSEEAERAEMRVAILDHLAAVFHVWDGARRRPIELPIDCPECRARRVAYCLNPLSFLAIAYCRECGWARELRLGK